MTPTDTSLAARRTQLGDWARSRLEIFHREKPIIRVLVHPAAEQNPSLVVTCREIERLGGKVTMLERLDDPALLKLALTHDVLHLFNLRDYQSTRERPAKARRVYDSARMLANLASARALGLRIVWTLPNDPFADMGKDAFLDAERRGLCALADRLICPSMATYRLVQERRPELPESKLAHIPHHNFGHYFPRQVSRREGRAHLGIAPKGRVFICFGGIHPYKGLTELIPLFGKHPLNQHSLIVAGHAANPSYAATIEGLCGHYENVYPFLRYIERDELQYYVQAADYFVIPYKDVQGAGSAMLAMNFGKPLIAPSAGAIAEAFNPVCSVLVESAGAGELRRALIRALDLNLDRAGAELRRLNEVYAAERLTRRLVNTYLEVFPKRQRLIEEGED